MGAGSPRFGLSMVAEECVADAPIGLDAGLSLADNGI